MQGETYGEPLDTTIRYFPVTYSLDRGRWGFQLMVPQLRIEGLGNVLVNIGGVNRAVAATQVSTSSGIGDSIASLIYRFDPISASAPFVELRLDAKLPTADEEKGLGTGEADYSIQVDLSQNLGTATIYATLGYNFRGTSTLYEGLQDSAFAPAGLCLPTKSGLDYRRFLRLPGIRFVIYAGNTRPAALCDLAAE